MPTLALRDRQSGFVLLGIFLVILLAGVILLFTRINSAPVRDVAQDKENREKHAKIQDALVNFVNANGYLPCPANGASATGLSAPNVANPTCAMQDGVVPWATIGLSAASATDPYQNKISYRVYAGAIGLTQANGATMALCDSVRAALPVPQTVGVDANGLCRLDHDTSPAQFLAGKGLSVTDSGVAVPAVALVLISHGKNGAGAYRVDGSRSGLPNNASAEYGHTQAAGPFVVKAANTAELSQTDVNYFDDTVTYLKLSELIARAKVSARNWPDPAAPSTIINATTFTSASTAAAAAAAGATPVGTSTKTSTLTINGIVITASGASARDISSLNATSGYGIGVLSTSATTGGVISNSDVLKLAFGTSGQKFALMLVDFGRSSGNSELAQIVFKNGATTVLTTAVAACRSGAQLASYSIDVGAPFDTVQISALNIVSTSTSSAFELAEVALCGSGATTCATTNATPTTNCPYP